jgi:predicted  nucleic acid-binding Zn-ribbon protein
MMPTRAAEVNVSPALVEAIAAFPLDREVRHCGAVFRVSPFDIYATCPACGSRVKVRSFAATPEVEDVFDAVLAWMLQPEAEALVRRRQAEIAADAD